MYMCTELGLVHNYCFALARAVKQFYILIGRVLDCQCMDLSGWQLKTPSLLCQKHSLVSSITVGVCLLSEGFISLEKANPIQTSVTDNTGVLSGTGSL